MWLRRCRGRGIVYAATGVKRDCFRDTNFHRRGCGDPAPASHIYVCRHSDTLNFVFTCLCGFTDRLFHYACFLCRKKYYRKIIITITPPTVMLLSHTHTLTQQPTHAWINITQYNIFYYNVYCY